MTGPFAPEPDTRMSPASAATRQDREASAESFLLDYLSTSPQTVRLGDMIRLAAQSEGRFSPEETRGAVATLVDNAQIELTDDLVLKPRRSRRR
jgi:hypothetical protein